MKLLLLSVSKAVLLVGVPYLHGLRSVVRPSYGLHGHRDVNVPVHELCGEQRLNYFLLRCSRGRLSVCRAGAVGHFVFAVGGGDLHGAVRLLRYGDVGYALLLRSGVHGDGPGLACGSGDGPCSAVQLSAVDGEQIRPQGHVTLLLSLRDGQNRGHLLALGNGVGHGERYVYLALLSWLEDGCNCAGPSFGFPGRLLLGRRDGLDGLDLDLLAALKLDLLAGLELDLLPAWQLNMLRSL